MKKVTRKKIPLKDKETVKRRLAKGKSLREAIKGTRIQSPNTARNIANQNKDSIARIKKNYLVLIESFNAKDVDRAKLWAEMTTALKIHGTNDNFIEIPDWANREKALKYIDSLKGISGEGGVTQQTQVNIFNRVKEANKAFVE